PRGGRRRARRHRHRSRDRRSGRLPGPPSAGSGLFDFAGPDARRANASPARVRAVPDADALDVREPAAVVSLVGEAHGLSVAGAFPADLTVIRQEGLLGTAEKDSFEPTVVETVLWGSVGLGLYPRWP